MFSLLIQFILVGKVDATELLKVLEEKFVDNGRQVSVVFIDLGKALDRERRNKLMSIFIIKEWNGWRDD